MSRGRCSTTEAVNLLVPAFSPTAAADELTRAIHGGRCRPYCNGKMIPSNIAPRLMVEVSENDGRWTACIESTSFAAEQSTNVWEFEIDEVRALLPPAVSEQPTTPAAQPAHDDAQPPQRHRPGTRYKDDWPLEMVPELIRIAHHPVDREMLGNLDGQLVPHMKAYLKEQIGWAPQDPKAIREKLVVFLRLVR